MVFIYGLFAIVPLIDPKKKTDQFQQTINKLADIVALFFLVMFFLTLFNYLGYEVQMDRWVLIGVTLLFLLLGNYFGKLKPNYFISIRTPWTLENEENWRKTHRLSGMIWVVGSLIMLSFLIFNYQPWVVILFVAYAVTLAAIPIGYSFWLYKREE